MKIDRRINDLSLQGTLSLTVLVAGALGSYAFWKRSKSLIPTVPSWLPFIGSGTQYLASPCIFSITNRKKYGSCFWATIFGRKWLFIYDPEDINKLFRAKEQDVSMYQAFGILAGSLLPQEDPRDYDEEARPKIFFGRKWDGPSATAPIAHTMRPQRLRAWVPSIRELLQENFSKLPDTGRVDLFQWCNDLVSAITVRVMLGDLAKNADLAHQWVELLRQSEPEAAFSAGPLKTFGSFVEITLKGEREIFGKIRELIYPHLDQSIEDCIAGKPESDDASVLSGMVRAMYHTRLKKNAHHLRQARRRLANDMFFFTFAAITNSFAAAAWVIYHTLRNTEDSGIRIRLELDQLEPDSDSLPEMEKVIYEISRLYTPGSMNRLTSKPFTLPSNGETIPAGVMVAANVADIHRNPAIYSDPLKFDPSRFDEGRDERVNAGCNNLGFGAGMHPCVGRKFAVLEIALFASEALKTFDFELEQCDTEDEFTSSMIANVPNHPPLSKSQTNSIWRPSGPVWVSYKRK